MNADLTTEHTSATLFESAGWDVALDPGIRPLWRGARIAAPAFTVQGAGGDNLALHHAVMSAPAGHVLVVDVGGRAYGHWGEILTVAALARGIRGLVIDGCVRDSVEQEQLGFPVFSRGLAIRGTGKEFPGYLGRPVIVGGKTVRRGDLIVADADGIVALPSQDVDAVMGRADERVAKEVAIMAALRAGETTMDLYGFNPEGTTAMEGASHVR